MSFLKLAFMPWSVTSIVPDMYRSCRSPDRARSLTEGLHHSSTNTHPRYADHSSMKGLVFRRPGSDLEPGSLTFVPVSRPSMVRDRRSPYCISLSNKVTRRRVKPLGTTLLRAVLDLGHHMGGDPYLVLTRPFPPQEPKNRIV